MKLPNSALVYYDSSFYEVDHTNTRVNVRAWVMAVSENDHRDFEDFAAAVDAWYSTQVAAHDDFELVDIVTGTYTWGEYEIRIEADRGVDGDYEVLFSISELEPINPNEPMG